MPQFPGKSHERQIRLRPLAGGLNDARNPTLLGDGETPDCRNIEFNHDAVESSGGAVKFGNQVAPRAGILTKAPASLPPLRYADDISVPSRGYAYLPYQPEHDLGGDFVAAPGFFINATHHGRRGRSFEFTVAFQMPKDEPVYGVRNGKNSGLTLLGAADSKVAEFTGLGSHHNEAAEEFCCIIQKGGDRLAAMSWALGIVNVGSPATWAALTGDTGLEQPSTYALCFTWLDAPRWGRTGPAKMRYYVGAGGTHGTTVDERYSTQAHRAIVVKAFIEPGRNYRVAVSLGLDTGTISGADTTTPTAAWNSDGTFSVTLSDDQGNVTTYSTLGTNLFVWKGPTDSYDYLTRYGVRFSGRDAMFCGLGMRFAPWAKTGFVPLGLDSAALEAGGHRMMDTTDGDAGTALGYGSMTCSHVSGSAAFVVSSRGLFLGGYDPLDARGVTSGASWIGLTDGTTVYNSEALRNYWLVPWKHANWTGIRALRGCRIRINEYQEVGGPVYQFSTDLAASTLAWTAVEFYTQGFRWSQRPLLISNVRIFSGPRGYGNRRVQFSLQSETLLDDQTDTTSPTMLANWLMDDAEGGVLRESVGARDGFLAPFTLAKPDGGGVFLSGEGERLTIDFSEDQSVKLALDSLSKTKRGGIAIELEIVLGEGYYGLEGAIPQDGATYFVARHAPVLASWGLKDTDGGVASTGLPVLEFGHRCRLSPTFGSGTEVFHRPLGFVLAGASDWDQVDAGLVDLVHPWNSTGPLTPNWATDAPWVGKTIRVQFGLHSTGVDGEFLAYIAASPKQALFPEAGDPGDAEMVYYTTQTIRQRDLARSVISIGGRWAPFIGTDPDGYSALSCRMLLKQARVFACPAPGRISQDPLFLATTPEGQEGSINFSRDGKLIGGRCLPAGVLEPDDILRPLGPGSLTASVADESTRVTPGAGSAFSTALAEDSLDAVERTLFVVSGDGDERRVEGTLPEESQEFYAILSVVAAGSALTLARPFTDEDRVNAWARSFRLIAYSAFEDDLSLKPFTVTAGTPFTPGLSTASANALVGDYFQNLAPPSGNWSLCLASAVADPGALAPTWWRGAQIPRRNPILGLRDFGGSAYAVSRGCLYELDDRWRRDGPTELIRSSLALRNETLAGASFPLEGDVLRFDGADTLMIRQSFFTATSVVVDAWVWLDDLDGYRTALWIGNAGSDPSQPMGTFEFSWAARFADGYPELAVGSTSTFDGTNAPEKGLYISRASSRMRPRTWTHVRWRMWTTGAPAWIVPPECRINGRLSQSRVNATGVGAAAGQWILVSSVPLFTGQGVALVGAARDSLVNLPAPRTMLVDRLDGKLTRPERVHGLMHSLGGKIAGVVVDSTGSSGPGANFNPFAITYSASGQALDILRTPEGVGHKVYDAAGARYGVIHSHPFISLHHELGRDQQLASWAEYGSKLLVTTGGRPVYVQG